MHIRRCPECGEEFRPDIIRCSDCGAPLEDRYDDGTAPGEAAPPAPEPPSGDYQPVFASADSTSLREAAALLAAAGVSFTATGSANGFRLRVRSEDHSAAVQALAGREGALFMAADAPLPEGREADCPACGARLATGAVECSECQLVVGATAGTCAKCGSALDPAEVQCPACGAPATG